MPASNVIVAIALSTVQLCLGIWLGMRIRRPRHHESRQDAPRKGNGRTKNAGRASKLCECSARIEELNQRAQSLSSEIANHQPALSDALQAAVAQLVEATAALHAQADAAAASDAPRPQAHENAGGSALSRPTATARPYYTGESKGLTAAELRELATRPPDEDGQPVPQQRFPYLVYQCMAPCTERELPASASFEPVLCNDLSVNGISFFMDDAPVFEYAVVSVGVLEYPVFVLCRVRHSRLVFAHDSQRYLVGCEFVKRLPPEQFDCDRCRASMAAASH